MKTIPIKMLSALVTFVLMTSSLEAYNKQDAVHACRQAVTEHGHSQYHRLSDIRVRDQGHHSYALSGKVLSNRDRTSHHFTCNIRHREVISWNVSHGATSNQNTAAAIGVGILAVAAAAALSNNNRHANHTTGGNPFDDIKYLKRTCKQNIKQHIGRDHRRVRQIRFNSVHLDHHNLRGTGLVIFQNGKERDLTYTCKFDRRGLLYDGRYQFRRR